MSVNPKDAPKKTPLLKNVAAAPIIYFDQAPTLGTMNNIVELDLSARALTLNSEGQTAADMLCVAHLRCSFEAAMSLRSAITKALKMAGYHIPDDAASDEETALTNVGEVLARRVKELNS
jgi:hypothetical protein